MQNIAARAQALTDPGSVVVTARVRHQFALSVVEERGSHELKGVPEPVALLHMVKKSRSAAAAARSGGVSRKCSLTIALKTLREHRARGAR